MGDSCYISQQEFLIFCFNVQHFFEQFNHFNAGFWFWAQVVDQNTEKMATGYRVKIKSQYISNSQLPQGQQN